MERCYHGHNNSVEMGRKFAKRFILYVVNNKLLERDGETSVCVLSTLPSLPTLLTRSIQDSETSIDFVQGTPGSRRERVKQIVGQTE